MTAKFSFYEVVEIQDGRLEIGSVVGHQGAVLGRAQCDDGQWVYSIHVFGEGESWHLEEAELKATGTFMKREDFYDGESLSVEFDPKTGEGRLKERN